MSVKTFIENVIILAVENCLICEIPSILSPDKVYAMDDEKLKEIAGESEDVRMDRERLRQEYDALIQGLQNCQKFKPRESIGW